MKKFMCGTAIVAICFSLFFLFKIAEKVYFNETYYYAPDVRGFMIDDAKKALKDENLNIKEVGKEYSHYPEGEIFLQEPEPGEVVKIRRNIRVWVSKGTALVDMPNLVGMNFLEARSIVTQKGLEVDRVVSTNENLPVNEVIATDPASDTILRRGDKISFLISGTSQFTEVKMPDIIGLDLEVAKQELQDSSLELGKISFEEHKDMYNGIVLKTSVVPGVKLKAGTVISISLNKSTMEKPMDSPTVDQGDGADADGTINVDDKENEKDAAIN